MPVGVRPLHRRVRVWAAWFRPADRLVFNPRIPRRREAVAHERVERGRGTRARQKLDDAENSAQLRGREGGLRLTGDSMRDLSGTSRDLL